MYDDLDETELVQLLARGEVSVGDVAQWFAGALPYWLSPDDDGGSAADSDDVTLRERYGRWWRWILATLKLFAVTAEVRTELVARVRDLLPSALTRDLHDTRATRPVDPRRARIFIDVDGALSALPLRSANGDVRDVWGANDATPPDWSVNEPRRGNELPPSGWRVWTHHPSLLAVVVPTGLVRSLAAIVGAGVDVVWNTSWEDGANDLLRPHTHATFRHISMRSVGKVGGMLDDLRSDPVPFVWLEDDVIDPLATIQCD